MRLSIRYKSGVGKMGKMGKVYPIYYFFLSLNIGTKLPILPKLPAMIFFIKKELMR